MASDMMQITALSLVKVTALQAKAEGLLCTKQLFLQEFEDGLRKLLGGTCQASVTHWLVHIE